MHSDEKGDKPGGGNDVEDDGKHSRDAGGGGEEANDGSRWF